MNYSIELWQDGHKVVTVHSSRASEALWHIAGYAAQYEQDGPLKVKVKQRKQPKSSAQ